jgi:acetylornithine deacetylase/succinyl-diaminopimelate desuccinylase-like protein
MLMGHLDVVEADADLWTYPPFGGEIHDGFIWGRGATDMKQMLAVSAVILLALAEAKVPLKRDVLLVASADEEHGGTMGMRWLTREMPDLFDVAGAINEGGGGALEVGGKTYYACQSAEKGLCRTVWTARGSGGHASHPHADISTVTLCRALARLGDGHLQGRIIPTMREALLTIASSESNQAAARVEQMLSQGRIEDAMGAAGFDGHAIERHRPLFYDTVSVTGLQAGDPRSINVIPPTARAYTDARILPGQNKAGLLETLRDLAGDSIEIEVYERQYSPGLESSLDSPIFETIAEVVCERCDGARVIPWQCAGSTDAKHLIPIGVPVYGFVPSQPLPEGIEGRGAHATDERLWLKNLDFALTILYDIVYRFCAAA